MTHNLNADEAIDTTRLTYTIAISLGSTTVKRTFSVEDHFGVETWLSMSELVRKVELERIVLWEVKQEIKVILE